MKFKLFLIVFGISCFSALAMDDFNEFFMMKRFKEVSHSEEKEQSCTVSCSSACSIAFTCMHNAPYLILPPSASTYMALDRERYEKLQHPYSSQELKEKKDK